MQIIEGSSVKGVIRHSYDRRGRNWVKHIVFPDFQRPYCWSVSDIQKILDDIDELRYAPEQEDYRYEDEYYLGAICVMPVSGSVDHDQALLDGQQRLTSLMILARILYERAMRSSNPDIRGLGGGISWLMGGESSWKQAFLYQEPATHRRIRQVYSSIDREYRQLEADSEPNAGHPSGQPSFYEETLLRDLRRFRYILTNGKFAVTVLETLKEAEQYFQGENNRGLPMSLLDILKAYHMRFETSPDNLREIRRIWNTFNEAPKAETDEDSELTDELIRRRYSVENHVIPALLMRFGIEPWDYSANTPKNADLLKGIIGTHRRNRIVDGKISSSSDKHLFDLLEPVPTGIGFFRMLEQYLCIDEAIDTVTAKYFDPVCGLSLNYDQKLTLRLALIAWADRFALRDAWKGGLCSEKLAGALASDPEFRSYARYFARFLSLLRSTGRESDQEAYGRLDKKSLLRCLQYENSLTNLIFLPHRSSTPAACRRELTRTTTPDAMNDYLQKNYYVKGYQAAYEAEFCSQKPDASAIDGIGDSTNEGTEK